MQFVLTNAAQHSHCSFKSHMRWLLHQHAHSFLSSRNLSEEESFVSQCQSSTEHKGNAVTCRTVAAHPARSLCWPTGSMDGILVVPAASESAGTSPLNLGVFRARVKLGLLTATGMDSYQLCHTCHDLDGKPRDQTSFVIYFF